MRNAIEQVLYSLEEAFEGYQSLLSNLRSVSREDWETLPASANRTILDIVRHVGECKYVYENHAWGDRSMRFDRPGTVPTVLAGADPEHVVEWLKVGQAQLKRRIEDMADDSELVQLRRANWGQDYETRWLLQVLIGHDLYHAGEINHIRSMLEGEDRWAYDRIS